MMAVEGDGERPISTANAYSTVHVYTLNLEIALRSSSMIARTRTRPHCPRVSTTYVSISVLLPHHAPFQRLPLFPLIMPPRPAVSSQLQATPPCLWLTSSHSPLVTQPPSDVVMIVTTQSPICKTRHVARSDVT